jgi:hypothetical protein
MQFAGAVIQGTHPFPFLELERVAERFFGSIRTNQLSVSKKP